MGWLPGHKGTAVGSGKGLLWERGAMAMSLVSMIKENDLLIC